MPILENTPDRILEHWPNSGRSVILDLEYTSWEGSMSRKWCEPWEWREIVQVGALVVEARDFSVVHAFESFVKPVKNPALSAYFKNLTGIRQEDLDERGLPYSEMTRKLKTVFEMGEQVIYNGWDGQVLIENCLMHQLELPFDTRQFFNFRPLLAKSLNRLPSELTSCGLPALAGIKLDLQAHCALKDCQSIAASLARWRSKGII